MISILLISLFASANANGGCQITTDPETCASGTPLTPGNCCIIDSTGQCTEASGDDCLTDSPSTEPTVEPTVEPTADPTIDPTSDPTMEPTLFLPDSCDDKCDAFSVLVDSVVDEGDTICVNYTVSRLFGTGDCKKSVKYITLGLCDGDDELADAEDVNGLIQDFRFLGESRRRLLGRGKSKKGHSSDYRVVYGVSKSGITGIRVNAGANTDVSFEICLTDVFLEDPDFETTADPEFSNIVEFKRGSKKYICDEPYLQGLPCLNTTAFEADAYDDEGLNALSIGSGGGKSKHGHSGHSALIASDATNDENWGALATLDPYVRYSLVSIFIIFGSLILTAAFICLRKRQKGAVKEEVIKDIITESKVEMAVTDNTTDKHDNDDEAAVEYENEYYEEDDTNIPTAQS